VSSLQAGCVLGSLREHPSCHFAQPLDLVGRVSQKPGVHELVCRGVSLAMRKASGPGRCVYCLKDYQSGSWDHVFPRSWYPNTTPQDMEKWKVPSCIPCNHEFSKTEQDLLIRLGLGSIRPIQIRTKSLRKRFVHSTHRWVETIGTVRLEIESNRKFWAS
jgi:hypothetical protein